MSVSLGVGVNTAPAPHLTSASVTQDGQDPSAQSLFAGKAATPVMATVTCQGSVGVA